MSMNNQNDFLGTRAGVMAVAVQGLTSSVMAIASGWGERAERRRVTEQLSALTDRELADIGLNRQDVRSAAIWNTPHADLVSRPI